MTNSSHHFTAILQSSGETPETWEHPTTEVGGSTWEQKHLYISTARDGLPVSPNLSDPLATPWVGFLALAYEAPDYSK